MYKTILDIQNVSALFIGIYALYIHICFLYEEHAQAMNHINIILDIILKHAIFDFVVNKSYDIKLHHLFIFGGISYMKYHNIEPSHIYVLNHALINTEITTVFYVFKYWLPEKSTLYSINLILFYLSFFKIRVYDFYSIIQGNRELNNLFDKYERDSLSNVYLVSIYGLYMLNLYWFCIMTKVMVKRLLKPYFTNELNNNVCFYLRLINIPMSAIVYSIEPKIEYIFDIMGTTALTITRISYPSYGILKRENIKILLKESLVIHVKSFINILLNMNYKYKLNYILLSCFLHLYSLFVGNIISMLLYFDYNVKDPIPISSHNIVLYVPILFDNFLIFINSPNEIAIPLLLINVMDIILRNVEPFYNLNNSAIEIVNICKTYYLCQSNINSISH